MNRFEKKVVIKQADFYSPTIVSHKRTLTSIREFRVEELVKLIVGSSILSISKLFENTYD